MPVELTTLDWVLVGLVALLAVIGLFRGISGELGSLLGLGAALAAGYFLYGVAQECALSCGLGQNNEAFHKGASLVIDFVFALIAGGLVRHLVKRFVSFLIGGVLDKFLGLLAGTLKGCIVLALLTGVGIVAPGEHQGGFFASHSVILGQLAALVDGTASAEGASSAVAPLPDAGRAKDIPL